MRDIGKNIRDLRQQKGMTQEELAEKLYVTRQTISNYEQGKTRPDIDMLVNISSILDVDINVILYGIPPCEDRRKKITQSCISFLIFLVSAIIYNILYDWSLEIKRNAFNSYPIYWIMILFRPFAAYVLGRTIILVLELFVKLPNRFHVISQRIKLISIGLIVFYILIMLPFLLLDKWPWTPSTVWKQTAYYLLDVLPTRTSVFSNGFWGFLLGFFLYKPNTSVPSSETSNSN